jgi:hypothetical protein
VPPITDGRKPQEAVNATDFIIAGGGSFSYCLFGVSSLDSFRISLEFGLRRDCSGIVRRRPLLKCSQQVFQPITKSNQALFNQGCDGRLIFCPGVTADDEDVHWFVEPVVRAPLVFFQGA